MERWLPVAIPDCEGYEVSDCGNARSIDRWITFSDGRRRFYRGQDLKPVMRGKYQAINIGHRKMVDLHVAVLTTFKGDPEPGQEGRHRDDDRANNALSNLVWGTRSQNMYDAVRNGTHYEARKIECEKGHPFDEANTYRNPAKGPNSRTCRACMRDYQRDYHARKKD